MAGSAPARRTQDPHEVEQHGHGSPAPVVVNGVSSDDEPSVEWGWHGHYPRVAHFAGFLVAAIMLVLLIGNHTGLTEDIWLVVLAVGFAALSTGAIIRSRTSWRR